MRKKGFTLIELLVVIAIIAMLLAILMPALSKVKKIAQRVVCGTNLKGLGTAQTVYANDYDDEYAVQGRNGTFDWTYFTDGFQNTAKDWSAGGNISIGASLYLLVREADVSPKSFVCPSGDETEYDGKNTGALDIVELWDFGNNDLAAESGFPHLHVSYAYHMPYGAGGRKSTYAADGTRSASFAVMADKNPYQDPKIADPIGTFDSQNWRDRVSTIAYYWETGSAYSESSIEVKVANSYPHDREGQNVLFADGHSAFEKTSDVGVNHDQIYLPKGGAGTSEEQTRRGFFGALSSFTSHDESVAQPSSSSDSLLMNDDLHTRLPGM